MVDPYIAAQIMARKAPSVGKTRLLNLRSNFPHGLVFAVEGDDDKIVYSYWIERARPGLCYEFLVLRGKAQVRNLKNSVSRDLGGLSADVKFLIDRDFDDFTGFVDKADVFMLDRYAIENYLVDREVIERSLPVAFPCEGAPHLRQALVDIFEKDYDSFLLATQKLNKRIYVARRLGLAIDDEMPVSIAGLVTVELGNTMALNYSPSAILPFPFAPSMAVIAVLELEFEQLDPRDRYRGKFAMKFLTNWLSELINEFRLNQLGIVNVADVSGGAIQHMELTTGAFASRASLPQDFSQFLSYC